MENYEEKYKEALERAKELRRQVNANETILVNSDLDTIFPELKESEDERIRKWIITYLENRILNSAIIDEKENCKNAISWLEKQGEQKPSWSEEDSKNLNSVKWIIENSENLNRIFETINSPEYIKKYFIDWLKSLKERVQLQQVVVEPKYPIEKAIYASVDCECLEAWGYTLEDLNNWFESRNKQESNFSEDDEKMLKK